MSLIPRKADHDLHIRIGAMNDRPGMHNFIEKFCSGRPFFLYAACNWHEHLVLGGDRALKTLSASRYAAILDISKDPFWVWFLPLSYCIHNRSVTIDDPISSVWSTYDKVRRPGNDEYGSFLRRDCLGKLFPMGTKVHNLLKDSKTESALLS